MNPTIAIVGAGSVGASCARALASLPCAFDLLLIDVDARKARGVAIDISHGLVLHPGPRIRAGAFEDAAGAALLVITAGVNERAGNAIDRSDPFGRLRLLNDNAATYREIVPRLSERSPAAPILVVTDPPDALADVARSLTRTNPVISSGTFLDSLRFRHELAARLGCHADAVDAIVLGEHGTSQVPIWSTARVGGRLVLDLVDGDRAQYCEDVARAVRFANIEIIEGNKASQHAIGMVCARIAKAILGDEGLVAPVGVWQPEYGVTLSLPSVLGAGGVRRVLEPDLTAAERDQLRRSAAALASALSEIGVPGEREVDVIPHRPRGIPRPAAVPQRESIVPSERG